MRTCQICNKNRVLKCWRPRSCFQLAPLARFLNFFEQKSSVNNELQVLLEYVYSKLCIRCTGECNLVCCVYVGNTV